MPRTERGSSNQLPPDILLSLQRAVQSMPTVEEADARSAREMGAGLSKGHKKLVEDENGRILLPPDGIETASRILDHIGFTEEQIEKTMEHEREHLNRAKQEDVNIVAVIVNFVRSRRGKALVSVELKMVSNSEKAIRSTISAPDDLSDHDERYIKHLDNG